VIIIVYFLYYFFIYRYFILLVYTIVIYLLDIIINLSSNGYMIDRLFGKELSNLLNPAPITSYAHMHKIPSKSTKEVPLLLK